MLFSDPFREFDMLTSNLFSNRSSNTIPLDAWKDESTLHLEFEIPGVRSEDINLEVDRNILTLTVDKPFKEITGQRLINNRTFGLSRRSISLGEGLNTEEIQADLTEGVLHLTIPIAEKAKPRRIAIGGSSANELEESRS